MNELRIQDTGYSDIHLLPEAAHVKTQGGLQLAPESWAEQIEELRKAFGKAICEEFSVSHADVRFRGVSIAGIHGKEYALRRIDETVLRWKELSLPLALRNLLLSGNFHEADKVKRGGIIAVAGKMDSVKSTTLNALLCEFLELMPWSAFTYEDPVEVVLPRTFASGGFITQIELDVAIALERHIAKAKRSNADIIKVGEIRTKDAAQMALSAALSGCLVLTTIHASGIVTAVEQFYRLIDDNDTELFAKAFRAIVYQELVKVSGIANRMMNTELLHSEMAVTSKLLKRDVTDLISDSKRQTQNLIAA